MFEGAREDDTAGSRVAWWAPGLALVAIVVLAISVDGFLAVGPGHRLERALFLVSVVTLIVAVVLVLRGSAQREDALALLREEARRLFGDDPATDGRTTEEPSTRRERRRRRAEPREGYGAFERERSDSAVAEEARRALFLAAQTAREMEGMGAHRDAAALEAKYPSVARLYERHASGLPALVDPEAEARCGGDYDALLK